ncbi:MAG: tetratricopeptide repeat protein [Planctomycetota bacterium]|jgi:tetratricopeptide (TPR) repeat protein
MHAEDAYFFRHAIVRDAAYELQLPIDRASLHIDAIDVLEKAFGGRPEEPELTIGGTSSCSAHASDLFSEEIAEHIFGAMSKEQNLQELKQARRLYLHRAAVVASQRYDHGRAQRIWRQMSEITNDVESADCMRRAGAVAYRSGRWDDAEQCYNIALSKAVATNAARLEGIIMSNLAVLYDDTGRNQQAEEISARAIPKLDEAGELRIKAFTVGNLAVLYQNSGRLKEAEQGFEESIALLNKVGDRASEGAMLNNLANLFCDTGRAEQGEATLLKALEIHRQMGDRRSEGVALSNLAHGYAETKGVKTAEETFREALQIHREVGDTRFEGITLGNLAVLQQNFLGDPELAEKTYRQALVIQRAVGDTNHEASTMCNLGLLRLTQGDAAEAETLWVQGIAALSAQKDLTTVNVKVKKMTAACKNADIEPFDVPEPGTPDH